MGRVERPGDQALLEREAELGLLGSLVAEAASDGRIALVEGPAGIGKTRLVAAVRAAAAAAGTRCLAARGAEMERSFAFGVVRQLFEPLLAAAPAAEREELLAGPARLAGRLLLEPAGDDGGAEAGGPFAVYHGLYWLTANLAARGPVALVVDDAHWCDPPSLDALAYLARRIEGLPVLLVLASRPHEPGFDRTALDALAREPGATVLALRELSERGTEQLVHRVLSVAAEPAFCRACHAATGGNPLLVAQLASALAAEGVAGTAGEVARVEQIGPEAVARAVRLRLARLPADATALAEAASVLGEGAALEDAAALAGLDAAAAAAAARALVEVDVLRSERVVAFAHPVVRGAVYAGLGPIAQRAAHARAARVLAAAARPAEQVAAQLLEAPAGGDPSVVAALRDAARRALADGAPGLAVAYLARALAEPPAAGDRVDVLLELGTAEQLVAGERAGEHLREALALAADPARRAAIAASLGRSLYMAGAVREAEEAFAAALRDPEVEPRLARSLETGVVVLGLFEPALVALARERLAGLDPDAPLDDLDAGVLLAYGTYDRVRCGEEAGPLLEGVRRLLGDRRIVREDSQGAWAAIGAVLWATDRFEEADALAREVTRAGEETGSVFLAASGAVLAANGLHRRGALVAAEAYLGAAIETARENGFGTVVNWAASRSALVLLDRGDAAGAAAALAVLGLDGPVPDTVHLYEALLARGCARIARGALVEGVDDLRELGRRFEALGARNPDIAPWRVQLALGLVQLGERDEAERVAGEALERARAHGTARHVAAALRARGLAGGGEQGLALLAEAVETARACASQLELALALVELGAAERRANRRADARPLLEEGVALAHRCGARGLEDRGLQELLQTGARPRRAPASGREALTPSELRVAELAASGQTNREIAQRLFVTQKTVESHLARTFRKLGIESRARLAAALAADAP